MNMDLDYLVKKAIIADWLRDAENSRIAHEAMQTRPKQARRPVLHQTLSLFCQSLAGVGRILVQAGCYLENRYS